MDWKDGLTLYSHDINISKDSFDLENNLGVELFRANRIDEAAVHFENSAKIAPDWWTNWNNLGVIAEKNKDLAKAEEYYLRAIKNGNYYLAYENLANIYLIHLKEPQKARNFIREALMKLPANTKLWILLSLSEYKLENMDEAVKAARSAYHLSPSQQTHYLYSQLVENKKIEF